MLHSGSVSMNNPTYGPSYHNQYRAVRSPSNSSSSVVTVTRNPSPALRSSSALDISQAPKQTPGAAAGAGAELNQQNEGDPEVYNGVGNLNRWSQSTTSSADDLESPSYGPDTSASPVAASSARSTTRSNARSREGQAQFSTTPALASLHNPPEDSLPTDGDFLRSADSFTPPSATVLTPRSDGYGNGNGNGNNNSTSDYFGTYTGEQDTATARHVKRRSPLGNLHPSSRQATKTMSHGNEDPSSSPIKQPRTRDRKEKEKDKKAMLSKALEKANTAVLLDNALNFEGALDAYQDACKLLHLVMERTSGVEDKRKLDAIRDTYAIRIDELMQLQEQKDRNSIREEKELPARPESVEFSPAFRFDSFPPRDRDSGVIGTATMTRIMDPPSPRTKRPPRHSFLTDAIREVEGGTSEGFLGPLWERSKSPGDYSTLSERTARPHEEYDTSYMPRPLTPRRAPSPNSAPSDNEHHESQSFNAPSQQAPDPVSWLDTIDESASSRASSLDTTSPKQGLHRRQLSNLSERSGIDLDAAFDAAVEAAYEDGYEPDHGYAISSTQAVHPNGTSYKHGSENAVPSNHRVQQDQSRAQEFVDFDEEAEEERILDELTKDYIDQDFNLDMQSKSALPRQSGSTSYTRNTWESSLQSYRNTAGTSFSAAADSGLADMGGSEEVEDAIDPAAPNVNAHSHAQSGSRPLSVVAELPTNMQDRRGTGPNFKNLKIETSKPSPTDSGEAVAPNPLLNNIATDEEARDDRPISEVPSLRRIEKSLASPHYGHSGLAERKMSVDSTLHLDSVDTSNARSPMPRLFRKKKSSMSLRDHLAPEEQGEPLTPSSGSLACSSSDEPISLTSSRLYPSIGSMPATRDGGGVYLFDTSLTSVNQLGIPEAQESLLPLPLEPCPQATLLRPFWLLRCIGSTITHPRGGYLTNRLFVPRDAWLNKGVKLKYLEDKIANCDLLTAALSKLSGVDTYDADATLDDLQSFEEVMERVQATLIKRLGSEVGVQSVGTLFKDAVGTVDGNGPNTESTSREGSKTDSGKRYLSSWRKLRSKNSGFGAAGSSLSSARSEKDGVTMPSVPMTSFASVEKRTAYKRDNPQDMMFEGPHKEYMSSLARLCEAAQVLDQAARQVEDPGLKHSSPTHVGLELSIRHAAEFFGFYICRFALADIGILLDKYIKRSTEWVIL